MHKINSITLAASAILLGLTLTGCGSNTVKLSSADERIWPALPEQARVSRVPIPSACLPTCLSGLKSERMKSLDTLTNSGLLAAPANESTTK